MQHTAPRTISMTEWKTILRSTLEDSLPGIAQAGETLDELGETTDCRPVEIVGETLEDMAEVGAFLLQFMAKERILLVNDDVGTRGGLKNQEIAKRAFEQVKKQAH